MKNKKMLEMSPWLLLLQVILLGCFLLAYIDIKKELMEIRNFSLPTMQDQILEKVFQ